MSGVIRSLPDAEGVIQLQNLQAVPGVRHGFATRRGRLEDVAPAPVGRLRQVHGADVLALPHDTAAREPFYRTTVGERPPADALMTDVLGATVAVAVADCLPILFADPRARVVAAVHAGWRGLAAGVIENTVAAMTSTYGSNPSDVVVGIGPAIGPCCFEVGPEVIEAFAERGYEAEARVSAREGARPHADLGGVAAAILRRLEVPDESVIDAAVCTLCNSEWLWSYRRDGDAAGRMLCGIALSD
jgi:YfiH family protein